MIDDDRLRRVLPFAVCLALVLVWVALDRGRGGTAIAGAVDVTQAEYRAGPDPNPDGRELSADRLDAGLRFEPGADPRSVALVQGAVAAAHPEARRLIELVDGVTTVRFRPLLPRLAGQARTRYRGTYEIEIDLHGITTQAGTRALKIALLHELGHVIDFALVSDALRDRMEIGQPPCPTADCRAASEVFAEHFARWATGDLGIDVPVGYQITAPVPVQSWGAPLSVLVPAG